MQSILSGYAKHPLGCAMLFTRNTRKMGCTVFQPHLYSPCKAKSGWNWLQRQPCHARLEADDSCIGGKQLVAGFEAEGSRKIFILGTIRRLSARGQHAKKQGARA
jgi:hypothetical protein